MKKLISLLLALTMVAAVASGCNKAPAASDKTPIADSMETVVNTIIEKNPVEFMGGLAPVDLTDTTEDGLWALKNYTGLSSAEKIKDVAVYEPMMGSLAFSMVLLRVNDAAETKAVAQEMKDNIDPNKWICVQADQMMVVGYCDVVMLIMLSSELEGLTAQSFVDAFKTVCGAELDFTL